MVAAVAITSRQNVMIQPNMSSLVPLLPAKKSDRGAFTWKIWAAVQKIAGRSGQRVARSGMGQPSPSAGVTQNRPVMICVLRQYSPKYAIQNRKAIRTAGLQLGMLSWGWIGLV